MRRIPAFFLGLVVGCVITLVSMKYHVVRAEDGMHLIPKATASLSFPYVDVREFDLADWNERRELTLAIVQADKGHLLEDAAYGGLRQTMESVLDNLR